MKAKGAFIQRRMIYDNIMVAHELIHSMKLENNGNTGWFAAKMDMSKAYERVEWEYLEGIMLLMGFASQWVQLVMSCVRIVTYSIIIKGKQSGDIKPSKGLR